AHAGPLGRMFGTISVSDNQGQIAVRAFKKAEDSDDYILRLQELEGRPVTTNIKLALPFQSAREINAAEETMPRGTDLKFTPNGLEINLKPYQPRTIAFHFRKPTAKSAISRVLNPRTAFEATPLELPFNMDGISTDANRSDGDFDGKGQTIAGELFPASL